MVEFEKLKLSFTLVGCYLLWRWLTQNGKQCLLCVAMPHFSDGCLHDLSHPLYNAREASKQIVLLEHHLFDPRSRCVDCIRKHFLTIEALLDEAVTLDKGNAYHWIHSLPCKVRNLASTVQSGCESCANCSGVPCDSQTTGSEHVRGGFNNREPNLDSLIVRVLTCLFFYAFINVVTSLKLHAAD